MTGYTKQEFQINNTSFFIAIKSLNSNKGLDMSVKLPRYLIDLEKDIKELLMKHLIRGKIDFKISESNPALNTQLDQIMIQQNMRMLKGLAPDAEEGDILNAAISLPNNCKSSDLKITPKLKKEFLNVSKKVISSLLSYRQKEGRQMKKNIVSYINNIVKVSKQLIRLEKERIKHKKVKIIEQLNLIKKDINYSAERLEAEMIYYLEKQDITEERVRLQCHCSFFLEVVKDELTMGRKLTFLCQEMLREINTIGSKANNFEIQKRVVQMKEDLDKTKEQLQNIL